MTYIAVHFKTALLIESGMVDYKYHYSLFGGCYV